MIIAVWADLVFFYLCSLWLWLNFTMHTASTNFIDGELTAAGLLGKQMAASHGLLVLLGRMESASTFWTLNHAVRLVTTLVTATTALIVTSSTAYDRR